MEAKRKLEKLIAASLGAAGYIINKTKGNASLKVSERISHKGHTPAGSADMVRVTDDLGNEYLCPVSATRAGFVEEAAKRYCFDYGVISKNILSNPL